MPEEADKIDKSIQMQKNKVERLERLQSLIHQIEEEPNGAEVMVDNPDNSGMIIVNIRAPNVLGNMVSIDKIGQHLKGNSISGSNIKYDYESSEPMFVLNRKFNTSR